MTETKEEYNDDKLKAEYQARLTALCKNVNTNYYIYGFMPHLYDAKHLIKAPHDGIDFNKDYYEDFMLLCDEISRNVAGVQNGFGDFSFEYAHFATWPSELLKRMYEQLRLGKEETERVRNVLKARGNLLEWNDAVIDGERVASVANAGSLRIVATPMGFTITIGANDYVMHKKVLDKMSLRIAKQEAQIYFVEVMKWRDYSMTMQTVAG